MFTKIDKKLLAVAGIFIILLLAGGFFIYKYMIEVKSKVQNINEGANTQSIQTAPQKNSEATDQSQGVQEIPGIEINSGTGGGLLICADKCGDGICQSLKETCDNLNCVCLEDKQECPQDCPD